MLAKLMFQFFKRPVSIADIPPEKRPKHIAIIMDGNGRWAKTRGLPRTEGHRQGALAVRRTLESCEELGITTLTLYCFSTENWKRPQPELDFLMKLLVKYLVDERPTLGKEGIRLKILGRRDGLSQEVIDEMDKSLTVSANNSRMTLCLAINYGSRQEIVDAVRSIAQAVQQGKIAPENILEETISDHLYTAGIPDPDLLIRTSGEFRISNFLLWQLSYSEIWITKKAWPDFGRPDLVAAIHDYARRDRRFGGINQ
jgi:undecaprenyl diphosphate synthase